MIPIRTIATWHVGEPCHVLVAPCDVDWHPGIGPDAWNGTVNDIVLETINMNLHAMGAILELEFRNASVPDCNNADRAVIRVDPDIAERIAGLLMQAVNDLQDGLAGQAMDLLAARVDPTGGAS